MTPRVALFALCLAGCGGTLRHEDAGVVDAAKAPIHADATVRETGARDSGHADAPREASSPIETVVDASLSAEAAAACNVTPPSGGCPGSGAYGWPDAAGLCDEAGVRTDCGRTGQPCCYGYCQGMQYCDPNDRCSPSCGHDGEPCCLFSFSPCPECLGDLVCLSHDTSPTALPVTTCSPRSACGANDAGYCLTCGGNALPCCADAGCSIHQAEFCFAGMCFTQPNMK